MARGRREPRQLKRGKAFEAEEKRAWHAKRGEDLTFEKPMVNPAGKRGRLDIFVAGGGAVAHINQIAMSRPSTAPRAASSRDG